MKIQISLARILEAQNETVDPQEILSGERMARRTAGGMEDTKIGSYPSYDRNFLNESS